MLGKPSVHTEPPLRLSAGKACQLLSPGEPGCAIVLVRQTSLPVLASSATMKHPLLVPGLVQPEIPAMTLPSRP
jgi:hypothetical protein